MSRLLQDLRYAIRALQHNRGFTLAVVLTLGIGIGANTAVFSIIENVLLRPLPFHEPDRLVTIWAVAKDQPAVRMESSGPEFEDYKGSRALEYVASVLPHFTYTWTGYGEPATVNCTGVTFDFFPMLGIRPVLGRFYRREEYLVDGVDVVISQRFWKQSLGGDPNVIGRVLNLDGTPQTVVGVAPPLPEVFPDTDIWAKNVSSFRWMQLRSNKFLTLIARLRPSVTHEQAEAELTSILRRGAGESRDSSVKLISLHDEIVGDVRKPLQIVMGAVALVLLISLVNVAYLLLARSWRRQPEIALRLSIGASRQRITRQFITENLTLAAMGGTAGLALAAAGVRLVSRLGDIPRSQIIHLDIKVLCFAIIITFAAGLLLAWAPVAVFSRLEPGSALKAGLTQLVSRSGLFRPLLVSEVALTVLLLVGAGLLSRSFWKAQHLDPGFQPDRLLTAYLRTNDYPGSRTFFRQLVEETASVPGVRSSALSDCVPAYRARQATLRFADRPNDPYNIPIVQACWVSPDYFRTIGATVLEGRPFNVHDDESGRPVVIVNRAFAQAYWRREDVIGERVAPDYVGAGRNTGNPALFRDVVGVVADIKQSGLDLPAEPAVYMPYLQDSTSHVFAGLNLFVKTAGEPRGIAAAVRAQVYSIRSDQPITSMQTMDDVLFQTLAGRRFNLALFGSFAILALLLSAVGIYGMIAYSSNQRIREMGVRIALGAQRPDIQLLVLKEGLTPAAIGVVVGVLISMIATSAISGMLFGVAPRDPGTLAAAGLALLAVAAAACFPSARRAAKVDPMVALRYE